MNTTTLDLAKLLPLLIPILVIQLGLQVAALINLYRQPAENIKGSKWVWAVIIIIGEILGPIAYFVLARKEA